MPENRNSLRLMHNGFLLESESVSHVRCVLPERSAGSITKSKIVNNDSRTTEYSIQLMITKIAYRGCRSSSTTLLQVRSRFSPPAIAHIRRSCISTLLIFTHQSKGRCSLGRSSSVHHYAQTIELLLINFESIVNRNYAQE